MNSHRISAAAVLLYLISFGAPAAQPAATAGSSADISAQSPSPSQSDGEKPRPCMQTGSRLPTKGHCVNAAGQVVTREELDASGAMTVGDALRRTVPSATIR
ncbi:MAG: hypothetical protein JWQ90_5299 [Hydrocarboniphaga sp.]|uniref:hypothetical protein n=1 Tax=Hydrocarboniphaga sp. TaxID=2033016 RepID=UPI00260304B0|nr:hypothetical protein [Hydrocarboniphaga sp.]MDB5972849.1 hypothetical protein [Hydrocarboniphaga sp.]